MATLAFNGSFVPHYERLRGVSRSHACAVVSCGMSKFWAHDSDFLSFYARYNC